MQRRGVVLGMDADRGDAELVGGLGDADGDLAAIGDQEFFQHGGASRGKTPSMAKRLLIVAHAPSENTLSLRAAVERGARSETDIEVRVVAPLQAGPDDVLAAQAVILGTTENLGYMSGALKDFFDRSYNPLPGEDPGPALRPLYPRRQRRHRHAPRRRDHHHRPALARRAGAADLQGPVAARLRPAMRGARRGDGGRAGGGHLLVATADLQARS